ncbi:Cytosolic sulfotransferase 5 [Spatholobus suberectus]|nr:Cytosolic sulfotransferase 5 [Spatholobus suberectus]
MPEGESSEVPKYLRENEVSEECKDVIATLPMERGWVANHLYQYQGFWHSTRQLQGVLCCQKHFEAHDTDILIVSTPKSGTTWLKAWTFALLHRNQYPNTQQNHPLLTNNPHFLVPFLELDLYLHSDPLPDLTSFPSPRLFSTHLPYTSLPTSVTQSSCKIVYLCRDPKDAFVSLWHFTNKLRPQSKGPNSLHEAFHKFCRGVSLYGPFWVHVLGYWHKSLEEPDKIMFMRFEEMKMKPGFVLKQLANFMGCPFSKQEEGAGVVDKILKLCSFDNLSNLQVNRNGKLESGEQHKAFFRRGEIGDWKNYLTVEMIQQLNTITEEKLAQHGLRF